MHFSRAVREGLSGELTLELKLAWPTLMVSLPSSFLLHLEQHPSSLPAGLFPCTSIPLSLSSGRPTACPSLRCSKLIPSHFLVCLKALPLTSSLNRCLLRKIVRSLHGTCHHLIAFSACVSPYLEYACIPETCLVRCCL